MSEPIEKISWLFPNGKLSNFLKKFKVNDNGTDRVVDLTHCLFFEPSGDEEKILGDLAKILGPLSVRPFIINCYAEETWHFGTCDLCLVSSDDEEEFEEQIANWKKEFDDCTEEKSWGSVTLTTNKMKKVLQGFTFLEKEKLNQLPENFEEYLHYEDFTEDFELKKFHEITLLDGTTVILMSLSKIWDDLIQVLGSGTVGPDLPEPPVLPSSPFF